MTGNPRVHILGLGSIGAILATDLIKHTNASVIPLLRSVEKVSAFNKIGNGQVSVKKLYLPQSPLSSTPLPLVSCPETFDGTHIDNLIITTKTYQTKSALAPYLSAIDSNTNIIVIQNGLGILEVLKEQIFLDNAKRPQLFYGVISHGVFQDKSNPYLFNFAGFAGLKIARLPWEPKDAIQNLDVPQNDKKSNALIQLLTSDPFVKEFGVEHMAYQELLLGQLYKFLINCCINPITAIVNAVNGELAESSKPVFTLIVDEALDVLRVAYKDLFAYENTYNGKAGFPNLKVNSVLNTENMVKDIIHIGCVVNGKNSSSMRQDTLYLRDTEIDYINGYVVTLARKFNIPEAKTNETICQLVNLRLSINRARANNDSTNSQ